MLGGFGGSSEHLDYFLKGIGVSLNESSWVGVVGVGSGDGGCRRRWLVVVMMVSGGAGVRIGAIAVTIWRRVFGIQRSR